MLGKENGGRKSDRWKKERGGDRGNLLNMRAASLNRGVTNKRDQGGGERRSNWGFSWEEKTIMLREKKWEERKTGGEKTGKEDEERLRVGREKRRLLLLLPKAGPPE